MIDIHTHILPAVDDGPPELAGAVAVAEAAATQGIRTVVATPHAFGAPLHVTPDVRDNALQLLHDELTRRKIDLELMPGFECLVVDGLAGKIADDARYLMPSYCMAGDGNSAQHRLLMELAGELPITLLDTVLFDLKMNGITPILAHPERHPDVRKRWHVIESFVQKGGKLQVTAAALAGAEGWHSRRVCDHLLRGGLVSAIASDAHRVEDMLHFSGALTRAKKLIGPSAEQLVNGLFP